MRVNVESGVIEEGRHLVSPNHDERPDGVVPSLLVIHGISLPPGEYGGPWIDALFTNTLNPEAHPYFAEIHQLRVSSHLLIRRDGELVQYVPFNKRAWHAGISCYQGRDCCNDFAIGIELEGTDDEPYEAVQYDVLAAVIRVLLEAYPQLSAEHITGHCDIAPERKSDPGPYFDWQRLYTLLGERRLAMERRSTDT